MCQVYMLLHLLRLRCVEEKNVHLSKTTDRFKTNFISIVKQLLLPQEFTSKSFLSLKHLVNKYR